MATFRQLNVGVAGGAVVDPRKAKITRPGEPTQRPPGFETPTIPGVWIAGVGSMSQFGLGAVVYSVNPKSVASWTAVSCSLTAGVEGISYANGTFVAGGRVGDPVDSNWGVSSSVSGKIWALITDPIGPKGSFADYASQYVGNQIIMPIRNGIVPSARVNCRFPEPPNPNPLWPSRPGIGNEVAIGMDSTKSIVEVRRSPYALNTLETRSFGSFGDWKEVFETEPGVVLVGLVWGELKISAVEFLKGTR